LALARAGQRDALVRSLAMRALALLDQQRYFEGAEEEVLAACAEVLRACGHADQARTAFDRARVYARDKLDGLADPAWRAAYLAMPVVRELLGG
ncbi:MAG TPA: hypothetical protein VK427_20910, partial [Kofleriaceae bacterium]|nr:hypothetical protein [Kofleriaceae bacterium]